MLRWVRSHSVQIVDTFMHARTTAAHTTESKHPGRSDRSVNRLSKGTQNSIKINEKRWKAKRWKFCSLYVACSIDPMTQRTNDQKMWLENLLRIVRLLPSLIGGERFWSSSFVVGVFVCIDRAYSDEWSRTSWWEEDSTLHTHTQRTARIDFGLSRRTFAWLMLCVCCA